MREAIVTMSDEALEEMGLGDLVAYTRNAGIRDLKELTCHGNGGVMQLEVEEELTGERLSEFKAVSQWEFVTEKDDTYLYLIEIIAPDLTDDITDYSDELIGPCDPSMTEHGATMELVGPQQTISQTLREYEAAGVSPELEKLSDYEGTKTTLDALTERQREIVQTAYDMGFYEVPREVSTEEIAVELGIDASTVAEHLQRAERNLSNSNSPPDKDCRFGNQLLSEILFSTSMSVVVCGSLHVDAAIESPQHRETAVQPVNKPITNTDQFVCILSEAQLTRSRRKDLQSYLRGRT